MSKSEQQNISYSTSFKPHFFPSKYLEKEEEKEKSLWTQTDDLNLDIF